MKNLISVSCLILSLLLLSYNADAQVSRHSFAIRMVGYNYSHPIGNQDFKFGDIYKFDDGVGVEISYFNKLTKRLYFAVPVKMGTPSLLAPRSTTRRTEALGNLDVLLQYHLISADKFISPYLSAGAGTALYIDRPENDKLHVNLPVALGLNIRLHPEVYLSLQSQYRFAAIDEGWHHSAGLHFYFGQAAPPPPPPPPPADRDGDGIADEMDACPDQAGPVNTKGCPDTDKDGIADVNDNCPTEKGTAAMKGCPDRDGDGIIDKDDACPTEKGVAALKGCPDADNDGITDKDDKCPREAGPVATGGCPDKDSDGVADKDDACPAKAGDPAHKGCPDTDKDGVYDNEDRCVDIPGLATNRGCPEMKKADKEKVDLAIKMVQFETGKATLLPKSLPVLDNIADVLNRYPYYNLVINGHTDNVGDDEKNLTLSKDRAKACFDYLVSKGVPASRLSSDGFGESKPVATNDTAAGRAQNRRVEFDLKMN